MATTEIITIINNSGKVISTGKQLVGIFKEAQAAYRDRKEAAKAQRVGVQRAKTFDVSRSDPYFDDASSSRRRSHDDGDARSHASSRSNRHSRRSRRPPSPEGLPPVAEGPLALTEGNLKAHSEISATTPSRMYRSPPAEAAPPDLVLSRPNLGTGAAPPSEAGSGASGRRQLVHRPRSDPVVTKKKSIDLNLAYGDIPPDLESRVDLDPDRGREPAHNDDDARLPPVEDPQEAKALSLMDRIEEYLEEAHCIQKTASGMIESLQQNPDAAAAVALSLAELSSLLGRLSPAFLSFLKGGSPAVFALLASPQFLIGTSIAVGVTVVMFGGWKISEVSDRKSSSGRRADRDGGESEAASERSHRSHRSSRTYEGSTVSRSSRHSSRAASEHADSGSAAGKPKEKKRDMIKQLFKMKKDKEDREKAVSVMV
ncbi:hypothetical protein VTH06DRAFT_3979 [Thermothelomyces fergusii]